MQVNRAMILRKELGKGWRRRMCMVPQKRQWIQQLSALQCKRGEKRGRKQQPSAGKGREEQSDDENTPTASLLRSLSVALFVPFSKQRTTIIDALS
jgi:hypothetical protein